MSCKLKVVVSLLRIIATLLSLRPLGKEDYEEIKTCLSATFEQVNELQMNGLTISGIHYSVTW